MVLVCPCAALTEGLVSLYIVCMCVNCLNIYYINLIVSFFCFCFINYRFIILLSPPHHDEVRPLRGKKLAYLSIILHFKNTAVLNYCL